MNFITPCISMFKVLFTIIYLINRMSTMPCLMRFAKFAPISACSTKPNGFAWICKIAQNEARRINAAQSARTLSIDEIACVDELRAPPSDRELVCDVKAAIDKLDQPFKRIVVCRIYYCMTYKEIADKLGLRLTTVYYNYKKALKFLRTFLTDC